MATNAEKLNIILAAETKDLRKQLNNANKRIEFFQKKATKDLGKTTGAFASLSKAARLLGPVLAGAFTVNRLAAVAQLAIEVGNLSRVANASTTEFQKFAIAARTVGIEQDKAADILKDVTDRVGDFLQTGGGPMKDFFEKVAPLVGVTAENFKNLSGPDALALFVDTLQRANASQQDFTFYLEAMASDATALLPLLKNNAEGLRSIGDEAEKSGRIMSEKSIKAMTDLRIQMDALTQKINVSLLESMGNVRDELEFLADWVDQYGAPALEKLIKLTAGAASIFDSLASAYNALTSGADLFAEMPIEFQTSRIDEVIAEIAAKQKEIDDLSSGKTGGMFEWLDEQMLSSKQRELARLNELLAMLQANVAAAGGAPEAPAEPAAALPLTLTKSFEGGAPPPPPSRPPSGGGIPVVSDETIRQLDELKSSYESLIMSIDPAMAATMEYAKQTDMLNNAVAAGVITDEQRAAATNILQMNLSRAKDEISGMASVTDTLQSGLESMFMAAIDGTQSMQDAFKSTAAAVIKELYRVLVVQQLVNAAMGAFGYTQAPSGAYVRTNASGGTLQAGTPSLVGENGPELIVPSKGSRILSHAQTMNALSGGGDGVTVVQNINVSTGVQQTVRTEIKSMMPQIAESAKAAVVDAKRRGGSYGRSF